MACSRLILNGICKRSLINRVLDKHNPYKLELTYQKTEPLQVTGIVTGYSLFSDPTLLTETHTINMKSKEDCINLYRDIKIQKFCLKCEDGKNCKIFLDECSVEE